MPTGDQLFQVTFADRFQNDTSTGIQVWKAQGSTINCQWTPPNSTTPVCLRSSFQNFRVHFQDVVFLALDFNSRTPALQGLPGSVPTASLQEDFHSNATLNATGQSTIRWLKTEVQNCLSQQGSHHLPNTSHIVLLQHHPLSMPVFIPEEVYSFSWLQKEALEQALFPREQPALPYWGVIAGHLHVWYNGTEGLHGHSTFRQWLTEACKIGSSISLVTVPAASSTSSWRWSGTSSPAWNLERFYGYDY